MKTVQRWCFWQALQPHPKEGKPQFVRGITAVGDRYICIGIVLLKYIGSRSLDRKADSDQKDPPPPPPLLISKTLAIHKTVE